MPKLSDTVALLRRHINNIGGDRSNSVLGRGVRPQGCGHADRDVGVLVYHPIEIDPVAILETPTLHQEAASLIKSGRRSKSSTIAVRHFGLRKAAAG